MGLLTDCLYGAQRCLCREWGLVMSRVRCRVADDGWVCAVYRCSGRDLTLKNTCIPRQHVRSRTGGYTPPSLSLFSQCLHYVVYAHTPHTSSTLGHAHLSLAIKIANTLVAGRHAHSTGHTKKPPCWDIVQADVSHSQLPCHSLVHSSSQDTLSQD